MEGLVDRLRELNRKERYYLVRAALGLREFRLHEDFANAVGGLVKLPVPADAFVAMDYHLEWVYAALISIASGAEGPFAQGPVPIVEGNQEDADLLIAFDLDSKTHLIFVEAKGATHYSNEQLTSKLDRLRSIFGNDGGQYPTVAPMLVLTSPRPPMKLKYAGWPESVQFGRTPPWFPLSMPKGRRVTRCLQDGTPSRHGTFWKLVPKSAGE
jgi:hypothetical protein